MGYTPTVYVDNSTPALSAANMNHLEQRVGTLSTAIVDTAYGHTLASGAVQVVPPSGFGWTTSPLAGKLTVDQRGVFSSTLDITTYKNTGGTTYYVNVATGSNSNAGTSTGAAFQTLAYALAKMASGDTVYVAAGTYTRAQWAYTLTASVNIIGVGSVLLTNSDVLTWTLSSGKTYTYQAARSAVGQVVDLASGGRGTRYTLVTSTALVESTPGSFYDDGTNVYVHTYNGRAADANIYALLTTVAFETVSAINPYFENLTIWGGSSPIDMRAPTGGSAPNVYLNNVVTGYSCLNDNVRILGCALAILVNCDTYGADYDGYGYHAFNGIIPKAIEIGCRALDNSGAPYGQGTSSDNGTTAHDGASVIRVNGTYMRSNGANLADVSAGTQSWNLGCALASSTTLYDVELTTGAQVWLDSCTGSGSYLGSLQTDTGNSSQIFTRGGRFDRIITAPTAY